MELKLIEAKFHWPRLSGSTFMRGGGQHPPDLHALKKPSPYRVNCEVTCGLKLSEVDNIWVSNHITEPKQNLRSSCILTSLILTKNMLIIATRIKHQEFIDSFVKFF